MTHSRFDEAVKALVSGTSRRQVLMTLVGGAGAAAIAAVSLRQEASAALGSRGDHCGNGNQCKSGCCIDHVCKRRRRCN
jgi:hypothetical protein